MAENISSQAADGDMQELLKNMDVEELQEFASALGDEEESWLVLFATHYTIYFHTRSDETVQHAVDVARKLLSVSTVNVETRSQVAQETSGLFGLMFRHLPSEEHLNEAIFWMQEAIKITTEDNPHFASRMKFLTTMFDLQEQLMQAQKERDLPGGKNIMHTLDKLIMSHPGETEEETINNNRAELADANIHPIKKFILNCSLRNIYREMFKRMHAVDALEQAIGHAESVIDVPAELRSDIEPQIKEAWFILGRLLQERCSLQEFLSLDDLNYGIRCFETAMGDRNSEIVQSRCLTNTAMLLCHRHALTSSLADMKEAVSKRQQVLRVLPAEKDDCRPAHLQYLAESLEGLYTANRDVTALEEAIEALETALDILDKSKSAELVHCETQFASVLRMMYEHTGNVGFLDRGIQKCDDLLETLELECSSYETYWNVLAGLLRLRYDRTEVKEDICRSVDAARNALRLNTLGRPGHAETHGNLAQILWRRFDRDGNIKDLDEAVSLAELAVQKSPNGYRSRPTHLSTLSALVVARHKVTKQIRDMNDAVMYAEEAVQCTPTTHLQYPVNRNNLARILVYKSELESNDLSLDDLDRAVDIAKSVLSDTARDDAKLPSRLSNLGNLIMEKWKKSGSVEDLNGAIDALTECSECTFAIPSARIAAAKKAAHLLLTEHRYVEADVLLRRCIGLLRQLSPRSLHQKDQQHMISKFAGLATLAASIAVAAGASAEDALMLLEEGRGVILGLMFDIRSDVSDLRSKHSQLAAKFEALREKLDVSTEQVGPQAVVGGGSFDLTRRETLAKKLDEVIEQIRGQDGFGNFLQSPPIAELKAAASAGPIVVVNVSEGRSDAFIVATGRVDRVPLPDLGYKTVREWASLLLSQKITQPKMFELLGWLWDSLASPVLDVLQDTKEEQRPPNKPPRVWWIPTGPLCSLPIHAAGKYGKTPTSSTTLMDQVLSSYSTSIKAMLFAQRNKSRRGTEQHPQKSLIVSMGTTSGASSLPSADVEVEAVRKELLRLATNSDIGPVLREPDKINVLTELKNTTIFHFAGHGASDPFDPLQSVLLVKDWQTDPLTVKDLIGVKLHQKSLFLAYLSACSTGSNKVEPLLDESLHLMSACQLVGFQHTIGSLWEVSDSHSVEVAQKVYETMVDADMDDASVSAGLQRGLKALRDQGRPNGFRDGFGANQRRGGPQWDGGDPRIWAAYIHMGP